MHPVDPPRKAEEAPRLYARNAPAVAGREPSGADDGAFRIADPASAVDHLDPEAFYESSYDERLVAMIRHVIAIEGPIRDEVLARRIGNAHGFQRTGSRIRERVVRLARREARTTREDVGEFFWPGDAEPGRWAAFRRPSGGEPRAIDDIAMPELVALAVVRQGLDGEEAVIAMARTAGLQRLRAVTRERLERAWRQARATDA
jgi:hypothetical protein